MKVMVLTVVSGSWRHIGDSVMCDFDHQSGIYLNGYLHWIGLPTNGSRFIYAFDIESECFQQIPLPPWTLDKSITISMFQALFHLKMLSGVRT